MSDDGFAEFLQANERYAAELPAGPLEGRAAKGLAVLTCMDCRVDPLRMLGLSRGDAKVLRNAGGRVTAEVLDTLALAEYLLDVRRVMVIQHTKCRMASGTEGDLHAAIRSAGGPDTRSLAFATATDQLAAITGDVQRVRSWPYLSGVSAGGFLYDVDSGRVQRVC